MTMMAYPSTLTSMFKRGVDLFPQTEIVTRQASGPVVRHTYRLFVERTVRPAQALAAGADQAGR